MKNTQLFVFIKALLFSNLLFCQNWQPVADVHHQLVLSFFHDSVDNTLYIGGDFRHFNDLDAKGIIKWDGQTFSTLGDFPNSNCNDYNCTHVFSIAKYQGDIYCTLTRSSEQPGIKGIARWNGVQWDSIGGLIGFVYDQAIYNDELYIMGRFTMAENDSVQTIIKWDGENWYDVHFPYPYSWWPLWMSTISNAKVFNGYLYVGGNFFNDDGTIVGIAKYDGTNWYPVADGIKGGLDNIFDMEVYEGDLYVCGSFRKSAGNTGNKIMKLVGNEWAEVGGGFDSEYGYATKMLVYQDKLYVFGVFNSVGNGVPARNIAVWDGERWCGLGSTFSNSSIVDAAEFNGDLFICGGFDSIDGIELENFARWTAGDSLAVCGEPVAAHVLPIEQGRLALTPNPAQSTIHVSAQLPVTYRGVVRLSACNLLGQPLWQQALPAAGGEIQTTVDVSAWPPGVYFISLEADGQVRVEKVVVR